MRSLAEISRLNSLASIAKEQFLAKALNNPKDFHPRKPRIGGLVRVGLGRRAAKDCAAVIPIAERVW